MIELVECTRYAARITAKACESFRATDKARCGGCPGHQGVVATVEREERMSGKKVAACVTCGRMKPITGRGMCGTCHPKAVKADRAAGIPVRKPGRQKSEGEPGRQEIIGSQPPPVFCRDPKAPFSVGWQDQLFVGEDQLLARLNREAAKERRDLKQQLLYIVESYFEATFDVRED